MTNREQIALDNAIRDICDVSVTGAPKSKVREILTDLLSHYVSREKVEEETKKLLKRDRTLLFHGLYAQVAYNKGTEDLSHALFEDNKE